MIRCFKISSVYCFPALFKLLYKRIYVSHSFNKNRRCGRKYGEKKHLSESPQDEENIIFEAAALSIFLFKTQ
jgi:hypothetical protein